MRKGRLFSFDVSLCVLIMSFAMFSCSSSDSTTGSTDTSSLVENNPGGLNFIMEFDGEMDTSYPPGTMVASVNESFPSPPVAQAFQAFRGCVYFSNLPRTTRLIAAYWISNNALLFLMGPADYGTVRGTINKASCDDGYMFRARNGSVLMTQNFSFTHNGASTMDTAPRARLRYGF